jgi:phage tail sheath protein FI
MINRSTYLDIPDIYIWEIETGPRVIKAVPTGIVGIVDAFPWGPVNESTTVGDLTAGVKTFGVPDANHRGPFALLGALKQGSRAFRIVRVVGEGAAKSSITCEDSTAVDVVTFEAPYEGELGDAFAVEITDSTVASGTVNVVFYFGNTVEQHKAVQMADTTASNYLVDYVNKNSQLGVTAAAEGTPTTNPKPISKTNFSGGADGAALMPAGYIGTVDGQTGARTGLKLMETVDEVSIVIAGSGLEDDSDVQTLNAGLIEHAETMGDRIVGLNPAKNQSVNAVKAARLNYNSARARLYYPWVTIFDAWAGENVTLAPAAFAAGRLSVIPAHKSLSNKEVQGIVGLERDLTRAEVADLFANQITAVTKVRGRGYRFRCDHALTTDTRWQQGAHRRKADQIEESIYEGTQWAISENNNEEDLWSPLRESVKSLLAPMKRDREIYDYWFKCDDETNPQDVINQNKCKGKLGIKFQEPADFVIFEVEKLLTTGEVTIS